MSCDETGFIAGPDGETLTFDGLPNTNFRLIFPKAPFMTMMLQEFILPEISVTEVTRPTPFVNTTEIGEKITYPPFICSFMVDKNLSNYKEIYNWMKRMTVAGSNVDEQDNPRLIINGIEMVQFIDAWPMSIGELRFITTNADTVYMTCAVAFNYSWFEFV